MATIKGKRETLRGRIMYVDIFKLVSRVQLDSVDPINRN